MADAQGRNVARATATEGSRPIPLGALAHLLPPGIGDERCDLVTVMSEVRPVLLEQARNGPLVLFVDDLQLLDTTSATFVGQLVDADLVFLVATVRSETTLPPGLDALWHRARVRRIDLDDLDRAAVETLLHLVLRGPGRGDHGGRHLDGEPRQRPVRAGAACSAPSTPVISSSSTACGGSSVRW